MVPYQIWTFGTYAIAFEYDIQIEELNDIRVRHSIILNLGHGKKYMAKCHSLMVCGFLYIIDILLTNPGSFKSLKQMSDSRDGQTKLKGTP